VGAKPSNSAEAPANRRLLHHLDRHDDLRELRFVAGDLGTRMRFGAQCHHRAADASQRAEASSAGRVAGVSRDREATKDKRVKIARSA
jgi:hypothetical protein